MPDPWGAFPDAPQQGLVINMTKKDDPWSAFPDAQKDDTARTVSRIAGQGAQGANDAIAATIGAIPDIYNRFIGKPFAQFVTGREQNQAGALPTSENLKSAIDYTATAPSRLADMLMQGSASPLVDSRTSRFDPATRGEKIANKVGEGLGAVASTILPAGLLARAGGVTGAVGEALASQPAMQATMGATGGAVTGATDNPAAGLAASLAVPFAASGVRGVISPVTNRLTPHEAATAAFAAKEGVPLTPAQETGSPVLRGLEETMSRLPFGSGQMQKAYGEQRQAFNQSTLSRAGVDAKDASPDTLKNAFQQAGQTFDDLASRTTVKITPDFAVDVLKTANDYGRRLPSDVAGIFNSYVDDLTPLMKAAAGPNATAQVPQMAGDIYKNIRSDITARIRSTQDNDLKRALGGLVDALDNAMEKSATGSLAGEWKDARRQYQALMTVDRSMQGGTQADRAAGNIPLAALKGVVAEGDRAGFSRGRGQMNEPAQLADFLSTRVPNSGTPERMMWANLLTGGSLMGAGGVATAGGFTPLALLAAALTAGGPAIASRLYNTGPMKKYLTNEAAGSTDIKSLLAGEGGRQSVETPSHRSMLAKLLMRGNEQNAGRR